MDTKSQNILNKAQENIKNTPVQSPVKRAGVNKITP